MLLTNARSLSPKIHSLITMFDELELHFAIITESWLKDGEMLDRDIIDLEHGTDLKIIYKNRPSRSSSRRRVGGGVSIIYSKTKCNFKERRIASKEFEIVVAVGKVGKLAKDVAIIAIYVEPKMKVAELDDLRGLVSETVLQLKANCKGDGPVLFIGGDLNRRDLSPAFENFNDIERVNSEPTRGDACLDVIFSNSNRTTVLNYPPLINMEGVSSDHSCVFFECVEKFEKNFKWVRKTARKHKDSACANFGLRITGTDWNQVLGDGSPDEMVDRYEAYTTALVDELFPLQTVRARSNELPWITDGIRALARRKRRVYRRTGKSRHWMNLQARMDWLLETSKSTYVDKAETLGPRAYFTAVKSLSTKEKPEEWQVSSLFPELTQPQTANRVAEYFTQISDEFTPVDPVGPEFEPRRNVTVAQVAEKLKQANKPNSTVPGDVLPRLVRMFHDKLATPAALIFNKCFACGRWPLNWKKETAVIIPKTSNPSSLAETRNISCTNFLSKVMESFILDDLRAEIPLDRTQYGGIKGCSVDHLLTDMWDAILRPLEHNKHSVVLGIDFEKAFNRLDHGECLSQLSKLGASSSTITMVRAFLARRSVQVKLPDGTLSELYDLCGGSPQGSILGCLLYCLTSQHLNVNLARGPRTASLSPPQPDPPTPPSPAAPDSPDARAHPPGFGLLPTDLEEELVPSGGEDMIIEGHENGGLDQHDVANPGGIVMVKYVDDTTSVEAVDASTAVKHYSSNKPIEHLYPEVTESLLGGINDAASKIKMKVNCKKTQLLCVSLDNGCDTRAEIKVGHETIRSKDSLKLLGFMLGSNASMQAQFEFIRKKFRAKFWSLLHLRKAGIVGRKLYRLYCVFVRSVIETNCVIYDSMLTQYQSNAIERLQKMCVKLCFGLGRHYADICEEQEIDTLLERRGDAKRKFVQKAMNNPRFGPRWFRRREEIDNNLRVRRPFVEDKARTSRFYRSPLLCMQRIANDISTSVNTLYTR